MSQFGKKRLEDFYVDPLYINVNHGSYGLCPKSVMAYKRELEEKCELNTEKWFRGDSEKLINQMRVYVASKINCPQKNVYLVQNATDAINCLLKSMKWKEGDTILLPNTAYASIRKTVTVIQARYNVTIIDLVFTEKDFLTAQLIQLKVQNFVNNYPGKINLAILDHIISTPGLVLPVDSLALFFAEKGIPLFIDGAHAIGQIPVDMAEIKANAYFSNFHKWSFAPKNAAFLYLDDKYVEIVKPVITGNFHGMGPERQYYWTGTRDFSSYLCIKKGVQYHQSFGVNKVAEHNHNLVIAGAKRAAQIFGTNLLTEDPRCIGSLANVRVPSDDPDLCSQIAFKMLNDEYTSCFPAFFQFDGKVYWRLSAQIFNEISDYEFAANTILRYLDLSKKQSVSNKSKL